MTQRVGGRAGLIGLIAFLALDVLLVAFALNSTSAPVVGGGTTIGTPGPAVPSSTGAISGPTSATTTPTTATTGAPAASVKVVPLTVGVVAVDARTAFRFITGSCRSGESRVELTRNGGASWGPKAAPFDTMTRIRIRSDGSTFVVGADRGSGCAPGIKEASSYDRDWTAQSSASGAWYRDPRDSKRVGVRSGGASRPCGSAPVVDLSVTDSRAVVLCQGGDLRVSRTGDSWETAATVPGALAVALASQNRSVVAVPGAAGCAGIAILDSASPDPPLGCATVTLSGVKPGTVSLSVSSDGGWLLVGEDVFRSNGDLGSWKKS
jgi:hypothetical protein